MDGIKGAYLDGRFAVVEDITYKVADILDVDVDKEYEKYNK